MAKNTIQGGTRANAQGHIFEDTMLPIFQLNGFSVFQYSEILKNPLILAGIDKYVVRNVPFTTIYAQSGKTEFVIYDRTSLDAQKQTSTRAIRVEAKWQQSAGSVDEKYPYMLLNGIYQYPETEIIFVVDGGGYKPGARKWLQERIDNDWLQYQEEQCKSIQLMTISEFIAWFNREFH